MRDFFIVTVCVLGFAYLFSSLGPHIIPWVDHLHPQTAIWGCVGLAVGLLVGFGVCVALDKDND